MNERMGKEGRNKEMNKGTWEHRKEQKNEWRIGDWKLDGY